MTDALSVILGGAVAGTLFRLRGGKLRLDYHDDYRERRGATALSVTMPLQIRSHSDRVVTPWLWGLLPENAAVLDRWTREFRASSSSPFSLLATPVGHDCAGAVQFAKQDDTDELLKRPGRVAWLSEDDVARRIRELKEDSTAWLGKTFVGQFSLAGAQSKTALLYERGRWGVPSGSRATTHILKPAVAGLDDHDLNEHLCLAAASRVGLTVVRSSVAKFGTETAIVIQRYDRREIGGRIVRLHQEDLCQALGYPPSRKYETEGGPGAVEILSLFRQAMAPSVADDAAWRFVDALAWNWLIAGTDAHAKNYSLLIQGTDLRLAPLYDVASALPYRSAHRGLRFAMKIGNDYKVVGYRNPWPTLAMRVGLDEGEITAHVVRLAQEAPDAFADAARGDEVVSVKRRLPQRLVELVAERTKHCLALISSGRRLEAR